VLFGWTLERIPIDSFSTGTWLRAMAFAITAAIAPIACAAAYASGRRLPTFATVLRREGVARDPVTYATGACLIALTLLSVETALSLVFDPRYRDLPFAPQSGAALSFLLLSIATPRPSGARATAETLAAVVLAVSAVYIAFNETFTNWQAIWLCTGLIGLAFILVRARDVQG
jgi:drug/metabolite transporter (DMT)-like permease